MRKLKFSLLSLLLLVTVIALGLCWMANRDWRLGRSFDNLISFIPNAERALLPGASDEEIAMASKAIADQIPESDLPRELVILYRKCGGQTWEAEYEQQLFPSFDLYPLDEATAEYKDLCGILKSIPRQKKTDFLTSWYSPRLFPFGYMQGLEPRLCIDIQTGRIYEWDGDRGIHGDQYESVEALLRASIKRQRVEFGR